VERNERKKLNKKEEKVNIKNNGELMNEFINSMNQNNNITQNDMPVHTTSNDAVVDMFFLMGAMRHRTDTDILNIINEACLENKKETLQLLLYARDIQSGMGERKFFRLGLKYFADNNDILALETLTNLLRINDNIIRTDDIIWLSKYIITNYDNNTNIGKNLLSFVKASLLALLLTLAVKDKDNNTIAKWLPRKNSQYKCVVQFMRNNGIISSYSKYQKHIASLSKTVEQQMSKNDWLNINLEHVPSQALKKYKKTFDKHKILSPYIAQVENGEKKLNAKTLFPNQLVLEILRNNTTNNIDETNKKLLDLQWNNLKKLTDLNPSYRAIPVIDVSGSMTLNNYIPLSMSLGLGLFLAENNVNKDFRNKFITFSNSPIFQNIYGNNIVEKVFNASHAQWNMSTNLEAVFDLILQNALEFKVPKNDMPTHIIIISDMEFNSCIVNPNLNAIQMIKDAYNNSGYKIPIIIFWNVNGRKGVIPAKSNENNVLLVSGASQNIVNLILKYSCTNPRMVLENVFNDSRYSINI